MSIGVTHRDRVAVRTLSAGHGDRVAVTSGVGSDGVHVVADAVIMTSSANAGFGNRVRMT